MIDDGSDDNSLQYIKSIKDNRINIISYEENKGLIYSLNLGLQHCKGEFIARMDADDIALLKRIEIQVDFLIKNVDVDLCGTWAQTFVGSKITGIWKQPITKKEINCSLLFFASFIHPTMMFRASSIKHINFQYDSNFLYAEDYELWCRFQNRLNMVNLPKSLLLYRKHDTQISSKHKNQQFQSIMKTIKVHFSKYFEDKKMFDLYAKIATQNYELSIDFLMQTRTVFEYLENQNLKFKWFDEIVLNQVLSKVFFMISTHLSSHKISTYKYYKASNYNNLKFVDNKLYLKYICKNLLLIGK